MTQPMWQVQIYDYCKELVMISNKILVVQGWNLTHLLPKKSLAHFRFPLPIWIPHLTLAVTENFMATVWEIQTHAIASIYGVLPIHRMAHQGDYSNPHAQVPHGWWRNISCIGLHGFSQANYSHLPCKSWKVLNETNIHYQLTLLHHTKYITTEVHNYHNKIQIQLICNHRNTIIDHRPNPYNYLDPMSFSSRPNLKSLYYYVEKHMQILPTYELVEICSWFHNLLRIQTPTVIFGPWNLEQCFRCHLLEFLLPPRCEIVEVLCFARSRKLLCLMSLRTHPHVKPHWSHTFFIWLLYPGLNIIPIKFNSSPSQ